LILIPQANNTTQAGSCVSLQAKLRANAVSAATFIQRSNRRPAQITSYSRNPVTAPVIWPKVAPGTEFFATETGA
jgi:hypothetical protein